MLSGGMRRNFSASAARLRNVGTSSRARERSSAPLAVNAVIVSGIRFLPPGSLLRSLGFVYFRGNKNVNSLVKAELGWTRRLRSSICLAEKNNLDCVDHRWIRMDFFYYLLF